MVFNPVLPSLISISIVLYLKFEYKHLFYLILTYAISAMVAFYLYPYCQTSKVKNKLITHQIYDYPFTSQYGTSFNTSKNKCVIIETYGKKCGQCIEAMRDLGNFFVAMEKKYNVRQEYVHIGKMSENDEKNLRSLNAIHKDSLYQDTSKLYYKNTQMVGFPYFNFYDKNGQYIESIEGYKKEFKTLYQKRIEAFLSCNCKK